MVARGLEIMSEHEFFEVERRDGVGRIVMNNPPLNVLDNSMMEAFNDILAGMMESRDLAAIVTRALRPARAIPISPAACLAATLAVKALTTGLRRDRLPARLIAGS